MGTNDKKLAKYKVHKLSDTGKTVLLSCRIGRNTKLTFGWAAAEEGDQVGKEFEMPRHVGTEQAIDKAGNPVYYTDGQPVLRFVWE